jgi:hypothetical protein
MLCHPCLVPSDVQRNRKRENLRICRAAWLSGVSVWEYRELVEGEAWPLYAVWERIAAFSGWPRAVSRAADGTVSTGSTKLGT